jgi:hypothetical protein
MARRSSSLGFVVTSAVMVLAPACGAQISTMDRACPCESGWTCCSDNVCVPLGASCAAASDAAVNQCPLGIRLGQDAVPGLSPDGAVLAGPPSLTVSGDVMGTLPTTGATVSFDYGSSATLQGGTMTQQGWIVTGGAAERYTFSLWAQDGDSRLPLQLLVYGPIELGPADGECYATLLGSAPLAASDATLAPTMWGKYFVAPYHPVVVAGDGTVSLESTSGAVYRSGYFQIEPAGE